MFDLDPSKFKLLKIDAGLNKDLLEKLKKYTALCSLGRISLKEKESDDGTLNAILDLTTLTELKLNVEPKKDRKIHVWSHGISQLAKLTCLDVDATPIKDQDYINLIKIESCLPNLTSLHLKQKGQGARPLIRSHVTDVTMRSMKELLNVYGGRLKKITLITNSTLITEEGDEVNSRSTKELQEESNPLGLAIAS